MKPWLGLALGLLPILLGAACDPPVPRGVRPDLAGSRWIAGCAPLWPPDNGFATGPVLRQLPAGTEIDRFGSASGTFFSPRGASYASRSLPYICRDRAYTAYRLAVPLRVEAGTVRAWFGEPGGGVQFKTFLSAGDLVSGGLLTVEPSPPAGTAGVLRRCQ